MNDAHNLSEDHGEEMGINENAHLQLSGGNNICTSPSHLHD